MPQPQAREKVEEGLGWSITSSLASCWERDSGGSSRHQAQPQQPRGHMHSGNRRQNLSTLPGSCLPVPSLFYTLNFTPSESGLCSDLLGNHQQGFAHKTGVLTAASFYKLGNGPEMGHNLPKVLQRSKKWYQGSTTGLPESKAGPFPLHQVIRTKELTSSDDPLARFASTSLYSDLKFPWLFTGLSRQAQRLHLLTASQIPWQSVAAASTATALSSND